VACPPANVRNGSTPKTVATDLGPVQINTPCDRDGSFDPKLVGKRQRRLPAWTTRSSGSMPEA
jgi:transposase-like protein